MLVVLTYDAPHRKTQDLLMRLHAAGQTDLRIIAFPWEERHIRKPLIPHRPGEPSWPCLPLTNFNIKHYGSYEVIPIDELPTQLDETTELLIVGGAGILPKIITSTYPVLNIHPGYIPYGRGLDSLKWSILKDWPIGITAHLVDERTDAGQIIFQQTVSILPTDTFTSLAMRQYEVEMSSFVPAIDAYFAKYPTFQVSKVDDNIHVVTRRMPARLEALMLSKFEERKLKECV